MIVDHEYAKRSEWLSELVEARASEAFHKACQPLHCKKKDKQHHCRIELCCLVIIPLI